MAFWKGKLYSNIIGYGVGGCYENTKAELSAILPLDYLCDRKWEDSEETEYDGIPIIRVKHLDKVENVLLVVFATGEWMYESIKSDLDKMGMEYVHVNDVIGKIQRWNGKLLKEQFPDGHYEDLRGNKIYFDKSLSDKITIVFNGGNNTLKLGKNITIANAFISFGNCGECTIGDNTEIIGAEFYVSYAKVSIGRDCLFSVQIIVRTHDGHHIFDSESHKRINFSKDVEIGDNVWVGFKALLLAGTKIGTGSVVGACAVTSGKFGEHKIIAGVPAKVIRENICWSKDDTDYFNHACLEECISRDALKYV